MAIAIPFGNAKFSIFDPGDCTLLPAAVTTLIGAYYILSAKYARSVIAYNAQNPTVTIPAPDTSSDPETSQFSSTNSFLYETVWDATANDFKKVTKDYAASYGNWEIPTTGNLKDVASLPDALRLVHRALKFCNDLIVPNLIIADPSGNTTITDDENGVVTTTGIIVLEESFDPVSGLPTFAPWNYLEELDKQQGV